MVNIHHFIIHTSEEDWGGSILVMEKNGKAFCRTYWFNDDNSTIYFDWLSVDNDVRRNGIATEMFNIHIEFAYKYDLISCLWVKKETWIHDWYERKGYVDFKDHENESNAVWMKKFP